MNLRLMRLIVPLAILILASLPAATTADAPECASPVAVVGTVVEDNVATIETHNPFPFTVEAWLVVSFEVNGVAGDFAAPITAEPATSYEDELVFSDLVNITGVAISDQEGSGNVDSSEPVGYEHREKTE